VERGIDDWGHRVSPKLVYRATRDRNLLIYRHGSRSVVTRKREDTVAVDQGNTRWYSGGFEIWCNKGEMVRVAFALDFCDREIMRWVATTDGIAANYVGDLMMQVVEYRFGASMIAPTQWSGFLIMRRSTR
jgi:putative transposase